MSARAWRSALVFCAVFYGAAALVAAPAGAAALRSPSSLLLLLLPSHRSPGNFFIRGSDLLALPNVTCDTSFNVELAHDEVLAQGGVVIVQVRGQACWRAAGERPWNCSGPSSSR